MEAGQLLDPQTGQVTTNAVVLVEDGRITRSGRADEVSLPRDAVRIDAHHLLLLPGLIDCHVHLCDEGNGVDAAEVLATPPSLMVLRAVAACARTLEAGFTTVRDAGGTPSGVKLAVDRGIFSGPRMLLAITILSQSGGHTDQRFPCGVDVPMLLPPTSAEMPHSVVDGVEPMRQRVREILRAGADWIKICTSGGVLSLGDEPGHAAFTTGEIFAAVDEAATRGKKVMAHAQAAAGVKNAVRAGVSTIEHGIWLDEEAIELMVGAGSILVPTLLAPHWVSRHASNGRMPAWAAEKARQVTADHAESFARAHAAGVRIAFGTDTGVGPHGTMGEELLLMNRAGMEPLDCVRAATCGAARALGLEGEVGTIADGARADLVGVAGNPLDDLGLLATPQNIALVMKGGTVVKRPR